MTLKDIIRPVRFRWFFLLSALLLTLSGPSVGWSREYIIGVGDILYITVLDNKEMESVVTVRPDMKITFPLIGDIQAAGLTAPELAQRITDELTPKIINPTVTVSLREIGSYRIYVLGRVVKSGVYHSRSELTLLQPLSMAGGIEGGADLSEAYVILEARRRYQST